MIEKIQEIEKEIERVENKIEQLFSRNTNGETTSDIDYLDGIVEGLYRSIRILKEERGEKND